MDDAVPLHSKLKMTALSLGLLMAFCAPTLHAQALTELEQAPLPQAAPASASAIAEQTPSASHAGVRTAASAAQTETAPYSSALHDRLVGQVRDGTLTHAQASATIAQWLSTPVTASARKRLWSDGVVYAYQAGDTTTALLWASDARVQGLTDYALPSAFQAARSERATATQGEIVRAWLARQPTNWQARIYEAVWLTDAGQFDAAQAALDTLEKRHPRATRQQRIDLLEARGALAQAQQKPLLALGDYADITAIEPSHRWANRESQFLLSNLAAAPTASRNVQTLNARQADLFSPIEAAEFQQQSLGQRLRWAVIERDQRNATGAERHVQLDQVIREMDQAIAAASAPGLEPSDRWRQVQLDLIFDRMTAWSERGRNQEVIDQYIALRDEGVAVPYYAMSAVGGAYQQLRRSDLAVPAYEEALRLGGANIPVPSDTHVGLLYAYLDTARFEQAESLLQKLEAATPPQLRRSPEGGRANPQYSEVRHLRALTQLYTNHPAQAERSFRALTSMAPMNTGFRTGQAETARLREHPEAALALYEEALTDHPDAIDVRAGYANALLGVNEVRQAREVTETLTQDAPDSIAVRNARRELEAVQAPRFDLEAGAAREGGALANREWRMDARVSTGLIDDTWRLYARQVLARAELDEGRERFARSGLGLQWGKGRWTAQAEATQANQGPYRTGLAGQLTYRASDAWRLGASFDSNSVDTPYKARRADIAARSAGLTAEYIVNESRSFLGEYEAMRFSDGNLRNRFGLGWRERWITGPRFLFDTTTSAQTSSNNQRDAPYFNPRRDASIEINTRSQWLTWKRDDRQLFQVVEAGAGAYRQSGQGTGPIWSLRYAHEWNVGRSVQVRYGIGISSHPYDGDNEKRREVFLLLSVPLQ